MRSVFGLGTPEDLESFKNQPISLEIAKKIMNRINV